MTIDPLTNEQTECKMEVSDHEPVSSLANLQHPSRVEVDGSIPPFWCGHTCINGLAPSTLSLV